MRKTKPKRVRAIRENRVCGADGVPIWYRATGDGPALVCCNGLGVSTFFWHYIEEYFGATHRIVVWDYRGHGKSGMPTDFSDWSMDINIHDLQAVLDDAEIDRAVLLGHSMGCQVVLEAWRHMPERIAGLVPMLGAAGSPIKTFLNAELSEHAYRVGWFLAMRADRFANAVTHFIARRKFSFHVARQFVIDRQLAGWEDFEAYFQHMGDLDVRVFFAMAEAMNAHSADDLLPSIDVPVLAVGGERDLFTPFYLTEKMVATIPDAELLRIKKGSHAAVVEQPELINLRLEKLFRERIPKWFEPLTVKAQGR
ncbi:MAG: alpha/beta hydrolase [Candidatus Lernaella stagnicola]|nr:alpha/beta hydrolase [Candidatus Lernaella stagnicola]